MSFTSNIRSEIAGQIPKSRHCQTAELLALIAQNARIFKSSDEKYFFIFQTESLTVAKKSYILLNRLFNVKSEVSVVSHMPHSTRRSYVISIDNNVERLIGALKLESTEGKLLYEEKHSWKKLLTSTCCKRAFLAGIFLTSGSVTNPEKSYHLELNVPDEEMVSLIKYAFDAFSLDLRTVERKGNKVIYIKDAEKISEFLSILGAGKSMMELENVRIMKGLRNNVNRQVNCETANIDKTVNAARKQIEDINTLIERGEFGSLSPEIQEVAYLRLDNPDASLTELAALSGGNISRSGINHRLRKISKLASGE
ncbi:MAG: DNA-binding protein WhiA [Lachnospiraceae bacterium]|nr:DNA-binding protein WhiA [Lachnospiraceae bacterium]